MVDNVTVHAFGFVRCVTAQSPCAFEVTFFFNVLHGTPLAAIDSLWLFPGGFCDFPCDTNEATPKHGDVIKWKHFSRSWPFVREFTGDRWIPHKKASDAKLRCFLWSDKRLSKQSWGWWFETPTCSYDVTVMERYKFRSHKFIRNKWNSVDPHYMYNETNHSKALHVSRYFLDLLSQSLELRDDWMSNHFEIWQAIPTQFQGDWKTLQTN